jgi:TolB-like protein/AraC-like DNA-binding protein
MVFREKSTLNLPFMTEPLPVDQIFIRRLTDIVMANLGNEEFGVKELVKESGMGLYSLSRRLHSINGKTVNQFIREVRLQKALEMLQDGEYKASEVAFMVGFSSPAYFNKCFHELYGYPPGKVKERISEAQKENIAQVTSKKVKRTAWRAIIFLSSVILILSAIVYVFFPSFIKTNSSGGTTGGNLGKSLAVLPFRNLSNNITDQYFTDGIMEEILTSLNRIHDLRVISRTTVDQFRNSKETITEIARKLHVNYILEGSGQKYGNSYRLRVQLIDVADDRHLWAESYELDIRETRELFKIQNQIAQAIASELKATITPEEKELIERIPTADMTAYDVYLKANNFQKEYQLTRDLDTYKQAVTFYKDALEIDSAFAKSYAGLASLYLTRHFREAYFEEDYLDSCLILAGKALSFDGQLDEAYHTIGRCYLEKGDVQKSLENFDRSLQINPNNSDAQSYKGFLLTSVICDYVGG